MKFLITDDSLFMRNMLAMQIKNLGHEIIGEASNGLEAEQLYFELKPDVVTMDITMPEVNGIEAVANILARDPKARIIMVTAMGQSSFVMEAIKLGCSDFIVKPIDGEKLKSTIEKIQKSL